jgi:hypothetical protein
VGSLPQAGDAYGIARARVDCCSLGGRFGDFHKVAVFKVEGRVVLAIRDSPESFNLVILAETT